MEEKENKKFEPNPIIFPLFPHPVYKERTDFRFNPAELKLVHSLELETQGRSEMSRSPPVDVSKDREIFKKKELKRVKEFIKFVNIFDPDAMVVIQADHGLPWLTDINGNQLDKVFTLIKISNECEDHLLNKIDNILLLYNAYKCSL